MTSFTKLSWLTVRSVIYKTVMADVPLTCDKQVTYIKVEARRGKSAIEIQKALEEVGSEFALPYSSITRLVRQFNNGRNTVSNKHLCGLGLCRQRPVKM